MVLRGRWRGRSWRLSSCTRVWTLVSTCKQMKRQKKKRSPEPLACDDAGAAAVNVRIVSEAWIWTGGGEERERCMMYMVRPSREASDSARHCQR